MTDAQRDAGFDDFLDAVEASDPYYLESASGETYLPPLSFDPATGTDDLTERPLPDTGELLTITRTAVATPRFADDAPFVVALADFGPVTLTGQLRGIDPEEAAIGQEVVPAVDRTETTDERILVFRPV